MISEILPMAASSMPYRVCSRCVLDTTAPEITFDSRGRCNFCSEFLRSAQRVLDRPAEELQRARAEFVARVRESGKGRPYDCVVGVSGGVDSSWALVQAVRLGLRPLAVHMDNGWNSELAQNNIANLVRGLGLDLFTYVIDWAEYRGLMQAFFEADVIDVELLYDNAMLGVTYSAAAKHGLKFILSGSNLSTEGIPLPEQWSWIKTDARNIRAIARRGRVRLRTFPAIGTLSFLRHRLLHRVRWIPFLDFLEYKKQESLSALQKEFGFKPYPYKHYESVFTRLYQGFLLPRKFGVDKRRVHLSTLVVTGQMTRHEALSLLELPPYPSADDLRSDTEYFLKKMGWTQDELEEYLRRPPRAHDEFDTEQRLWNLCVRLRRYFSRLEPPGS